MIYMTMKFGTYDPSNKKFDVNATADFGSSETIDDILKDFIGVDDCLAAQLVMYTPLGENVMGNFYQKSVKNSQGEKKMVWRCRT